MTDAQIDMCEVAVKIDRFFTKSGYINKDAATRVCDAILELISEVKQARKGLRQAQAERDWIIKKIRNSDSGPTACPSIEIWEDCDEGQKYHRNRTVCRECWLQAAKEATRND